MSHVLIALGGNIGNRLANLRRGVALLAPEVLLAPETKADAVSALYESAPAGVTAQPPFLNAVLRATTALSPDDLLDKLKAIEHAVGRRPGPRWGPRPLDLDILSYGLGHDELVIDTARLTIPHPRIRERGFVLRPLADLEPERVLPGWPHTVAAALAGIDTSDLKRVMGSDWLDG